MVLAMYHSLPTHVLYLYTSVIALAVLTAKACIKVVYLGRCSEGEVNDREMNREGGKRNIKTFP